MCLAERDAASHELRGSRDDEETGLELFELGPLVSLARILDREGVKVELGLNLVEQVGAGLGNPIQTMWRGRRAHSPASTTLMSATRRPSTYALAATTPRFSLPGGEAF